MHEIKRDGSPPNEPPKRPTLNVFKMQTQRPDLKRRADPQEKGIGPKEKKPRLGFMPGEETYLGELIGSKEVFEQYQKNLENGFKLDNINITRPQEAKTKYGDYIAILEKLKKEVYCVVNRALNEEVQIPKSIKDYYVSTYNDLKKPRQESDPSSSGLEELKRDLADVVNQVKELQRAAVPLIDFILARAGQDLHNKTHTAFEQFIERVKESEDITHREQRLRLYQKCLRGDEQSFKELRSHLQEMEDAHKGNKNVHISPLLDEFRNYRKNMIATGSLISMDCPQQEPNYLASFKKNLAEAMKNYEGLRKRDQALSQKERRSNALTSLSIMFEKAKDLHESYSDLAKSAIKAQAQGKRRAEPEEKDAPMELESAIDAQAQGKRRAEPEEKDAPMELESAIKAQAKGKGRAELEEEGAPMEIDIVRAGSPDSAQLRREAIEIAGRDLAERLQVAEYTRSGWEDESQHSESEYHESSSESESASASDSPTITKIDAPRMPEATKEQKTEDDKRNALYNKQQLMQMKLKILLLRDNMEYFSPAEIQETTEVLANQVHQIHQDYCELLQRNEQETEIQKLTRLKSAYKSHLEDGQVKSALRTINRHQDYMHREISDHLKKIEQFQKFFEQIETISKQTDFLQQCKSDALKADIRARELGNTLYDQYGKFVYSLTTVALAYMKDNTGNIITVLSINEGSDKPKIQQLIKNHKRDGESWTWAKVKSSTGSQHAEIRLIEYAKQHKLQIEALGVSRPCCRSCWTYIENSPQTIPLEAVGHKKPNKLDEWHPQTLPRSGTFRSGDTKSLKSLDQALDRTLQETQETNPYRYTGGDGLPPAGTSGDSGDPYRYQPPDTGAVDDDDEIGRKHRKNLPDWVTESDKAKITEVVKRGVMDHLRGEAAKKSLINYRDPYDVDVKSLLDSIQIFRSPENEIVGTNSVIHMTKELKRVKKEKFFKTAMNDVWRNRRPSYKNFRAAIPQGNESITWYWNSLYVVQKSAECPIAYNNPLQFMGEQRMDNTTVTNIFRNQTETAWVTLLYRPKQLDTSRMQIENIQDKEQDAHSKMPKENWYHLYLEEGEGKERKITKRAFVAKGSRYASLLLADYINKEKGIITDEINRNITQKFAHAVEREPHTFMGWIVSSGERSFEKKKKKDNKEKSNISLVIWK